MTTNSDEYHGWSNRETWCVALHMDSDPYYERTARNACQSKFAVAEDTLSKLIDLALRLDQHRGMSIDALAAFKARINWRELYDHYRAD